MHGPLRQIHGTHQSGQGSGLATNRAISPLWDVSASIASKLHVWSQFYVQWGIGAVLVIGALEGSFVVRQAGKLADLAERDINASISAKEITWSTEYLAARTRADQVNALLAMLVVVTIFLMVVQ